MILKLSFNNQLILLVILFAWLRLFFRTTLSVADADIYCRRRLKSATIGDIRKLIEHVCLQTREFLLGLGIVII